MGQASRRERNAFRFCIGVAAVVVAFALWGCSLPLSKAPDAGALPASDAGSPTASDAGPPPPASQVTQLSFAPAPGETLNPAPPIDVVVTDVSKAQDAYSATLALPGFPPPVPGIYHCPNDWGFSYQLTFSFSDGSSLTATVDASGCEQVQIPGTTLRWAGSTASYWSELTQDLGIPESDITPYMGVEYQTNSQSPGQFTTCTTDADCDSGTLCGYAVADGCAATGKCIANACGGANCALAPQELCGCEGQTILPVWSLSSVTSVVAFYTSAPSSGTTGPCGGSGDAGGTD